MPTAGNVLDSSGLLRFIRYAFMPNHLGYCGGDDNQLLLEQAAAGEADAGLPPLLARFTGATPYLRSIAVGNAIADPFDARVVEAYWIGNSLLERVDARNLYETLETRFGGQLTGKARELVLRKPPRGAKPYHLFHVIDVYRHLEGGDLSMSAMDGCRISWGQVKAVDGTSLLVDRRPLVELDGKLALGEARADHVLREVSGRGFAAGTAVGDWVSIHWGWVCEVLDSRGLANLRHWTDVHLAIANETI